MINIIRLLCKKRPIEHRVRPILSYKLFCYNYWNRMQKKETMSLSQKIKAIKSPLMTSGDSLIDSFGLKRKDRTHNLRPRANRAD